MPRKRYPPKRQCTVCGNMHGSEVNARCYKCRSLDRKLVSYQYNATNVHTAEEKKAASLNILGRMIKVSKQSIFAHITKGYKKPLKKKWRVERIIIHHHNKK